MSDSDATAALRSSLADAATKQKMLRMDLTQTSPGHFGWLVPPDGCNGASCLKAWVAKTHPNTCFQTASVDMNTGLKNNVSDGLNVRFDIYAGSLSYSADFAPGVNVRKGFCRTIAATGAVQVRPIRTIRRSRPKRTQSSPRPATRRTATQQHDKRLLTFQAPM